MTGTTSAHKRALAPDQSAPSVLVVEDDAGIATRLVRGLTRGGYRVDHVMTGGEALAWPGAVGRVKTAEPDVVLLDPEKLGVPGLIETVYGRGFPLGEA